MRALFDLAHCPDPQCLKSLVIELPAVVIPHVSILPDHKIKVGLLMNSLVTGVAADLMRTAMHRAVPGGGRDRRSAAGFHPAG
jgi:hypothetical protein